MKRLNDLEYLKLSKSEAFLYKLKLFFCAIPLWFKALGLAIANFFKNCYLTVRDEIVDILTTFTKGNWAVKLSFLIFGFGNLYYGQIMRGLLFLVFEVVFVAYMLVPSGGLYWLAKGNWFHTGAPIGTVQGGFTYDYIYDTEVWIPGDDSVKVRLYGLLTSLEYRASDIRHSKRLY